MFNYLGYIKVETDRAAFLNDLGGKEGFDIEYNVEFRADEKPNPANITIYNLTETTIASFYVGQPIRLIAGYREFNGVIFEGHVTNIDRERNGEGDLLLNLEVDDYSFNFFKFQISKSYAPGVSAETIIKDVISQAGYKVDTLELPRSKTYINGLSIKNSAHKVLQDVATDCSAKVIYQGNGISLVPLRKAYRGSFELSSETGLIGTLQRLEKEMPYNERLIERNDQLMGDSSSGSVSEGVTTSSGNAEGSASVLIEDKKKNKKVKYIRCSMFLKHDVNLGDQVRLNSIDAQGSYIVVAFTHSTDGTGSQITDLELEQEE